LLLGAQIGAQVDKENKVLHLTDTGIGMTKEDLIRHLGTIAKSGTSEFLAKLQETGESGADTSSLIGQFGVGFYSAFLVADTVVVTTKHNDDKQYIWTSNAAEYSIVEDPRPDEQLKRGTRVSLYLKEEAQDFLDNETIRNLVKKYSEFINWDIYLYTSKTVEVEEEEEEEEEAADSEEKKDDAETEVEEDKDKPKEKKKTTKTMWDWEVINANKPIWTRNPKDITDDDYQNFYKAFSKDTKVRS
jgi:heat shock protein beta